MNFLCAIKHAAISYGIRRKVWHSNAILSLGNGSESCELFWLDCPKHGGRGSDSAVRLCGPDLAYDLQDFDLKASDWEVI